MARLCCTCTFLILCLALFALIAAGCANVTGIPRPDQNPDLETSLKPDQRTTESDLTEAPITLYSPDATSDSSNTTYIGSDTSSTNDGNDTLEECTKYSEESCVTSCGSQGWRRCIDSWGPCEAPLEKCNGLDDDCDGVVDNGVTNACGTCGPVPAELCNGVDDNCNGVIDDGVLNACGACGPVPAELCNGIDDNCNGVIDDGVLNACGACGPANVQEECNGVDDNCNGIVDENCQCVFDLDINEDCVYLVCPSQCPYLVACELTMHGGDDRGCVASQPDVSVFYLQEGNSCSAGKISGTITCSSSPGAPLNQNTCPLNKPSPIHTTQPNLCPD